MGQFLWLLAISVDLAVFVWPLTVALVIAFGFSIWRHVRRPGGTDTLPWRALGLAASVPFAMLAYGALRGATDNRTPLPGSEFADAVVLGLLFAQLVILGYSFRRSPTARVVIVVGGATLFWWTLGAGMVTLMSVSGEWL